VDVVTSRKREAFGQPSSASPTATGSLIEFETHSKCLVLGFYESLMTRQ